MTEIKEGGEAPDFTLPSSAGPLSLHDLKGRDVILYFYPKDDTPGCTKEACSFRDVHPQFEVAGAVVLGVSPDDVASHTRFAGAYGLPFTLLADTDHKVSEAYGVWKEKSNYGKKYVGIERSTFWIGKDGKIKKIWKRVKPDQHAQNVLAAVS